MSALPDTILFPGTFQRSPSAGNDGVFHWDWVTEAFWDTKIKPMDFDAVVERCGNFLVIESKDCGVEIPRGQRITLETLWKIGAFTIFIVQGKETPRMIEIWYSTSQKRLYEIASPTEATHLVKRWRNWAEANPRTSPCRNAS